LILTRANGVRFQNAIYGGNLNGDKIEFGRRPEKLSIGQFVEFTAQWIAIRRKRLVGHETDSVFSRYNIVHKADLEEAAANWIGSRNWAYGRPKTRFGVC